jgi:hypothetical protein
VGHCQAACSVLGAATGLAWQVPGWAGTPARPTPACPRSTHAPPIPARVTHPQAPSEASTDYGDLLHPHTFALQLLAHDLITLPSHRTAGGAAGARGGGGWGGPAQQQLQQQKPGGGLAQHGHLGMGTVPEVGEEEAGGDEAEEAAAGGSGRGGAGGQQRRGRAPGGQAGGGGANRPSSAPPSRSAWASTGALGGTGNARQPASSSSRAPVGGAGGGAAPRGHGNAAQGRPLRRPQSAAWPSSSARGGGAGGRGGGDEASSSLGDPEEGLAALLHASYALRQPPPVRDRLLRQPW